MRCINCDCLKIIFEPDPPLICGYVRCEKFNIIIPFMDKRKLKRMTCDLNISKELGED